MVFLRLVDLLKFAQAQKPTQVVGVGHVAFASVAADEVVFSRVTHQYVIDVRVDRTGRPPRKRVCLDGKALLRGLDRSDTGDQFRLGGRKLLVALVGAVFGHHAKRRGICMQVEPEVSCRHKDVCGG